MSTPEQDLENLARTVAELRREMELENATFNAVHDRILDIRGRCDALARDVEYALKRAAESKVVEEPAPQELEESDLSDLSDLSDELEQAPTAAAPPAPAMTWREAEPEVNLDAILSGYMDRLAARLEPTPKPEPASEPMPELRKEVAPVRSLETAIGSYWFSRLGAISLLVGFVFLASYIQPHMTPAMRVGLSYLAAAVLCGIGLWAERAYPKFSRPVLAAGLVLAFFTSFAGHFIRPMFCFSLSTSTMLMLVADAAVVVVAGTLDSQPLGALALAMGFWVAVFAARLADAFTPLMVVFLAMVGVGLFVVFRWATVMLLDVVGAYLCLLWWMAVGREHWSGAPLFWIEMDFVTVYFAVFLAGDMIVRLRGGKESLQAFWQKLLPADACVLAARFINPIAYFLMGSLIFWQTNVFWDNIHYFYWPLGAVLAAVGFAGRRIERDAANEEDIFYVMASGLITLGVGSAFHAMKLSNVLALEGLCLFAIRRITGRPVFQYLSALHFVLAFFQFNFSAFAKPIGAPVTMLFVPVAVSDWRAFAAGLPTILFMIAPTFLAPLWGEKRRGGDGAIRGIAVPLTLGIPEIDELSLSHMRALAASVVLLRLFYETVRPDVVFGVWVLLVAATVVVAWLWGRAPSLWTFGGSLLVWAHLYFFPQLPRIAVGDPAWMFPAAIGLAVLTLAGGFAVEAATKGKIYEWDEEERRANSGWVVLTIFLIFFSVVDLTALIEKRAADLHQYPLAAALAMVLLVAAFVTRTAFPCLAGLFLLGLNSLLAMKFLLGATNVLLPALFLWTLVGVTLAAVLARCFGLWRQDLLRRAADGFRYGTGAAVVLTALVVLGLAVAVLRSTLQYDFMRFAPLAAMTVFALALGMFVEKLAGNKKPESGEAGQLSIWAMLTLALVLLSLAHVTLLICERAETVHHYPYTAAFAVGLMALAYLTRTTFPCLAGLALITFNTALVLIMMVGSKAARQDGFLGWTLVGAALVVCFERGFVAWGKNLASRNTLTVVLVSLATLVLLGLAHWVPWIGERYETVGVTSTAVALLVLGIAFRSAIYRRFGLGVFLYALGRVYLIDLGKLETRYKIIAFIVLGAVLIAVSYLYTRFKEQLQKWV